jgi:hypothetical protein
MQRIPRVLGCNEISRVTFYQFEYLEQCPLKGLVGALKLDGPLPEQIPRRASIVGTFHHRVLELAATVRTVSDLDESIEAEIALVQAIASKWPHLRRLGNASGWDEINKSASLARRIASRLPGDGASAVRGIERELQSRDGTLVGRPDYYSVGGGIARLREYKSGSIRDSTNKPLASYARQLLFYSKLLFDNYEIHAVRATAESLSGDSFRMLIDSMAAEGLSRGVSKVISGVNSDVRRKLDIVALARPSKDACAYCWAQVICIAFKRNDDVQALEHEQGFVEGLVVQIGSVSEGSMNTVTILDGYRKVSVDLSVPSVEAVEIAAGEKVAVQNLRRHGGRFSWGGATRVLSCE